MLSDQAVIIKSEDKPLVKDETEFSDRAVSNETKDKPLVEDEIEFHEGWAPSHYE